MSREYPGRETSPRLLLCQCAGAKLLPASRIDLVLNSLRQRGLPVWTVPDLCALAAQADPRLKQFLEGMPIAVAACHPRAVRWLFAAARAPLPEPITLLNLRATEDEKLRVSLEQIGLQWARPDEFREGHGHADAAAVAATIAEENAATNQAKEVGNPAFPPSWYPWFPVIDYSRCTQCMQCLSFCLFGVFGVTADRRLEVQHPENCKANCPACSRVCPETAIIFPKYGQSPINGDVIDPRNPVREAVKVDISALLGGDIYETLQLRNQRAKARFSTERDPEQALKERQLCLAKLKELGDIPPEVLMALPSREEIQRRADEAAAKARAARDQAKP